MKLGIFRGEFADMFGTGNDEGIVDYLRCRGRLYVIFVTQKDKIPMSERVDNYKSVCI